MDVILKTHLAVLQSCICCVQEWRSQDRTRMAVARLTVVCHDAMTLSGSGFYTNFQDVGGEDSALLWAGQHASIVPVYQPNF